MKKIGVILLIVMAFSLVFAADNSTTASEKITKAFACLEQKADDCSDLSNQEIALTILATPDKNFNDCVAELKTRKSQDNWGNVRDTALAVLALNHAGEETKLSEEWLIKQSKIPADLIWFIEEDSTGATECHVGYGSSDYIINIGENKKIEQNAGNCLTKSQSGYWLEVSPACYDEEYTLECNQNFIATLLYKNKNSPTIYVMEGTLSSPAYGSAKIKINSKCFGDSACDYEASIWSTLALLKTGHNVEEYIPYVIAMSDSNKKYFPDSFIYMITSYDSYAGKLISSQKLGNYWEADSSAYNRYYDTALAILSMSESTEQIKKSKDYLLFSQGTDGCWQGIRETAITLWALEKRQGKKAGAKINYCSGSDYFCIPKSNCPASDLLSSQDYFCPVVSDACCMTENLKTCSQYSGKVCDSEEICTGNVRKATDTDKCCTGECEIRSTENECESLYFTCSDECSDLEEPIDYSCDSGQTCCRTKDEPEPSSSWWIYLLLILIILVILAILWVYREKLKLWWFKFRTGYKKDNGKSSPPAPPQGYQKPGFPPIRRLPPPQPPRRTYNKEDSSMSDVFKKLKDMTR